MKAYWFSDGDRLRYGDRRIPAVGVTHRHKGPLRLCNAGLHASIDVLDALEHAPGDTLWVVECGGEIIEGDDKLVCSEWTYVSRHDVDLRAFARWCALQVVHLWNCPEVMRQYLETGDEALRAAAKDAAWTEAGAAARSAAWAAAWAAAWDAAMAADAARSASRAAQRQKLLEMAGIKEEAQ